MRLTTLCLVTATLAGLGSLPTLSAQVRSTPPPQTAASQNTTREERIEAIAKGLHAKVMTLDGHVHIDTLAFRLDSLNYGSRMVRNRVDLVKMEEGGLDAAFLIVSVPQGVFTDSGYARAKAQALAKFKAIHRLVDSIAPTRAALALSPADAQRIHASGKRAIFIGVENGYSIGNDLSNIQKFYDLGGRYMSLVYNNHSQLSDAFTGERDDIWKWNGLSPLGREALKEMNRIGMVIDVSHASKISMMQTLQISKAPVIASHSDVMAICGNPRNLDDEQLHGLRKNGGVVQLVAFNSYVKCNPVKDSLRADALIALQKEYGITPGPQAQITTQLQALPAAKQTAYLARRQEITDRRFPADDRATVEDFVRHIDYVVQLIGIDHVGISSDFDGNGGVDGWDNASETFNVTLALVKHGYSDEDIAKIWGGNLMRVMNDAQDVAKKIRAGTTAP